MTDEKYSQRHPGLITVDEAIGSVALYKERPEDEIAALSHDSGLENYVLLNGRFSPEEGVDYKRGDLVPLGVAYAQRLLRIWAVDVPGSKAARVAQMEATDNEAERIALKREELEARIKDLQQERDALGEEQG
jgi:hypothetical protein